MSFGSQKKKFKFSSKEIQILVEKNFVIMSLLGNSLLQRRVSALLRKTSG